MEKNLERFLFFRQRLKAWFSTYAMYLIPLGKFIVMMTVLLLMNWHLGYRYALMRWVLVILASLVSCLLPWSGMTALAGLYLLGHVSALSWEGAVILGVMMFAGIVLHYLLLPESSFLIVLVPLAFYLRIPYLIPLLAGLFGGVMTFVPVGIGVVIYYTMLCLEKNASFLIDPSRSIDQCFLQILNGLMENQEMVLALVAFCLVTFVVYCVSRLSFDYAKLIATAGGGILMLLCYLLGSFIAGISVSYVGVLVGCVICSILAMLISFWGEALDYSRPEFLQYEDDDYVYYVKAVPKMKLANPEPRVQEINARRRPLEFGSNER